MVRFKGRGLMKLRSKLLPLSLSESAMVVQCGERYGELEERRRKGPQPPAMVAMEVQRAGIISIH